MSKNDITKISLFGFLPIIIGGFIYMICRQKTILLFDWIKLIGLDYELDVVREFCSEHKLPDWIIYNLPDLLWVFGFTSVMLIIWKNVQSKIKLIYFILPVFIGVVSELLQLIISSLGTFDTKDLLFYTLGSFFSVLISKTKNLPKHEKQITTFI